MKPIFTPGKNIAMKVPAHEFEKTASFYRDVLGFAEIETSSQPGADSIAFEFGGKNLWIDSMPGISQAELWLEVTTDDIESASSYCEKIGCIRRDGIEPLPKGLKAFWIASPSNIIHLINEKKR